MRQSRMMSMVEAIANVVVGYAVAVATQLLLFACSASTRRSGTTWRSAQYPPWFRLRGVISCGGRLKRFEVTVHTHRSRPAAALRDSLTAHPQIALQETRLRKASL